MIESMRFTNVNGAYVDFNDDTLPLSTFSVSIDTRMTEKERAQQHGLYPSNTYLGKLMIQCEGDLLEQSSELYWAKRRELIGAIVPRPHLGFKKAGDLEMLFTGWDEAVTCECTIDGWPQLPLGGASPSRSPWQVNFKAFDPRMYGYTQSVTIGYGGVDNAGGRTYPHVYPRVYSGGAVVSEGTVRNNGNIETFPTVTFHGPVVSPYLSITISDGTIRNFTLDGLELDTVADTATVDFLRRTVTGTNGENWYNYAVGADWWAIEPVPLVNTVSFLGYSGDPSAEATIEWQNAYVI